MSRVANFCPICGAPTALYSRDGRERPVCTSADCGRTVYFDPKVAVVVWIRQGDTVLLVQRGMNPHKGSWALPAGFVEWNEAPEDAAKRETLEETGLLVDIDELLAVFPKKDDGLADIVIAYSATIIGGDLHPDDDVVAVAWYTQATIPETAFYPSQTLIQWWKDGTL